MTKTDTQRRKFWIVSPNVGNNGHDKQIVEKWKKACVDHNAAFMGYGPDDKKHKQIGIKFAHVIKEGDIMLIARRSNNRPDVVGFGAVAGKFETGLKGITLPTSFRALRRLSPFIPQSRVPRI